MKKLLRLGTLASLGLAFTLTPISVLAASPLHTDPGGHAEIQIARGGRGGGGRGGSRSYGSGGSQGRTGFSNYGGGGSTYRGSQRPSGGWSSSQGQRQTNAGNRQQGRQDNTGNRQDNRTDRVSDRTDLRGDRSNNRWDNDWAGWARPGWGAARPWNHGWYGGWSSPPWGWWAASSAVWGVGALATSAAITSLVDNAINDQVTYIVVPDTTYSLYYSSVQPSGSDGVSFAVNRGSSQVEMTADCKQGTLDGRTPQTAAEAQLLNAACQVAYGS